MQLEVLFDGVVVESREVGEGAVHIGRASVNELVLRDPGVSSHHAVIWPEGGALRVKDLGSTNGTFVNEVRLKDSHTLVPGDRVRFGDRAVLRVSGSGLPASVGPLRLERLDTSVSWGLTADRFEIPGAEDAALLLYSDGEVWLALEGREVAPVVLDGAFDVAGRRYVLRHDLDPTPDTLKRTITAYDYHLDVSLGAQRAVLEDRAGGARATLTTENRVALLYALGQRWLSDGSGTGRGWMDDDEAAVAVWGRDRLQHGANNYNVLVHRVRSDLETAGLDRWCIEKRQGRTRIRLASARVE